MIDISRRKLSAGLVALPALLIFNAWGKSTKEISMEGELPPLPEDLKNFADAPAYRVFTTDEIVGTAHPTEAEQAVAKAILAKAPINIAPWKVAEYFLIVGNGAFGKEWQPYSREWPVRANPLIMSLFKATRTIPQGDVTPWCAAFVNWCIAQGNSRLRPADNMFTDRELEMTSRAASSGSFRCWTPTNTPRVGDLVVFAERGTEKLPCGGKGHVSFYYGRASDGRLRILGGNQTQKGTSGAVTVGLYPLDGGENGRLKFLGFRTAASLHPKV